MILGHQIHQVKRNADGEYVAVLLDITEEEKTQLQTILNAKKSLYRKPILDRRFETTHKTPAILHENEIILSDKTKIPIIISSHDYKTKILQLLQDERLYQKLDSDPTTQIQTETNRLLEQLEEKTVITQDQRIRMTSHNASASEICAQPKLNQKGIPFRLISPGKTLPFRQLSKYIGRLLKKILNDEYNIRNTYQVIQDLKDVALSSHQIIAYYDAINLYSSIPIELAIRCTMQRWPDIAKYTSMNKDDFKTILQHCLKNGYISFDDKIYLQKEGLITGNPVSPKIAEIVLDDMFKNLLQIYPSIRYAKKYVDDILLITNTKDEHDILKYLNEYNQNIKFIRKGENNLINYLSLTLIRRQDGTIAYKYFASPDQLNKQILYFQSNRSASDEINEARKLYKYMQSLSHSDYHDEIKCLFAGVLQRNKYSPDMINKVLNES